MTEHGSHHHLRELALAYGLHLTQLNAICVVAAGDPLNRLTPAKAEYVAAILETKGEQGARDWARDLEARL